MPYSAAIDRLHENSLHHHFDNQFGIDFNLQIITAYDKNGNRDVTKEDFVFKDDLSFTEWGSQFASDICQHKHNTQCPYFWERWQYCQKHLRPRPKNWQNAELIVATMNAKTLSTKQKQIKRRRLQSPCNKIDKLLAKNRPSQSDEIWVNILYNACLLELSTANQLNEIDIWLSDCFENMYENQSSTYARTEYQHVQQFAKFIKQAKNHTTKSKRLTAKELLAIYRLLVPDANVRTSQWCLWRGKERCVYDDDYPPQKDILLKIAETYRTALTKTHPLLAICTLFELLLTHKPFRQYNEIFAIVMLNLQLQKYGYPLVAVRRRDIFWIESLQGEYLIWQQKPQTYTELILQYLLAEIDYLNATNLVPSPHNPYVANTPAPMITDEHFVWWENLPPKWQRLFLVSVYHPAFIRNQIVGDEYDKPFLHTITHGICPNGRYYQPTVEQYHDYYADVALWLSYPIPKKIDATFLADLFRLTAICLNRGDFLADPETTLNNIPDLQYFQDLQYLLLTKNDFDDLSGIAGASNLVYLNLFESHIYDNQQLQHLSGLHQLRYLNLAFNGVDDFRPLGNLTQLVELDLCFSGNQPANIAGFERLQQLHKLSISEILDWTPLGQLQSLQKLRISTDQPIDPDIINWLQTTLPNCKIN